VEIFNLSFAVKEVGAAHMALGLHQSFSLTHSSCFLLFVSDNPSDSAFFKKIYSSLGKYTGSCKWAAILLSWTRA
jgi:hypothetical protein